MRMMLVMMMMTKMVLVLVLVLVMVAMTKPPEFVAQQVHLLNLLDSLPHLQIDQQMMDKISQDDKIRQ